MEITLPGDLGEFVRRQVEEGAYPSESAVVAEAIRLLQQRRSAPEGVPLWERFEANRQGLPDDAWDAVPTDLAAEHDHYLYGLPKRSE